MKNTYKKQLVYIAILATIFFTGNLNTASAVAPNATNLSAAETYTEDTSLNLIDIVVSDVDSAITTATLTISNPAAGTLSTATSGAVTSTYVAGTGVWTAGGPIADVNTLLAGVTFTPTLNVNSSFTIATSVSDGVGASTGTKAVTGIAVNDAPVLDAVQSPVLSTIVEDSGAPAGAVGTPVSYLVDFASPTGQVDNVLDVDTSPLLGIAVTAKSASVTCYYSLNSGTSWTTMGTPSTAASRLLAANGTNRIYCQPTADLNGTVASAITFRAWDLTSGADGATADTTTSGGTTAFSTATDTANMTVTAVNDAPTLDNTRTPFMNSVAQDSGAPAGVVGIPVSNLVDATPPAGGLDNVSDVDSSPSLGIAITAANPALTCYYSINAGVDWDVLGSPSGASSRLLAAVGGNRVYCQPEAGLSGTYSVALTYRAWDQTSGVDGGTADTTSNGGTTAFSSATDTASLTVTGPNTAPVLDTTDISLPSITTEDNGAPVGSVGMLVSAIVDLDSIPGGRDNVEDPNIEAVTGIALINDDVIACYYSLNDGVDWSSYTGMGRTMSRLLAADSDNRVYCDAGNLGPSDEIALQFLAWDRTSGSDGALVDTTTTGGTTAFSNDSVTIYQEITLPADSTSPDTFILSADATSIAATTATFEFDSNEAPSTFECSIDAGAYVPCTSPYITPALPVGPHTFRVRATDASNNTDGTPAESSWTIYAIDPEVIKVSPNDGDTNVSVDAKIVYTFSAPVSESIRTDMVTSASPCDSGCPVFELKWSHGYKELTLTIDGGYIKNTTYDVSILPSGSLASIYDLSFTTGIKASPSQSGSTVKYGCHDPLASNYDPASGSKSELCQYSKPSILPAPNPTLPITQMLTSNRFVFYRNMSVGAVGDDVIQLQKFLNSHGFILAAAGPGSPGNEVNRFGALTRAALAKFQASKGIAPAVGYLGPLTMAALNKY